MAPILVLIPALIAIGMLNASTAARVAIRIYLPCIMLVPMYLQFRVGGTNLNMSTIVSVFLAAVGLFAWYGTLKLSALDVCVFAYVLSGFYADAHRHDLKLSIYALLLFLFKAGLPYLIGRTLIEQTGSRRQFAKVMVLCTAIIALLSTYEYLTQNNLFQHYAERLTHSNSGWVRQTRWGFARIAGPYGHAITAGMVFSTGLLLQLWLVGTGSWNSSKALSFFRSRRKATYLTGILALGLFMTQSRGPWIGCGFALIVASIGFARDRRRAATMALSLLAVALTVTSVALNKYTDVDASKTTDRDQLNASYRRDLIKTYTPLIDQGGLWGWGTPDTQADGTAGYSKQQTSIDNEYIRVAMWQGYVGVTLFVLMEALALLRLMKLCNSYRNRDDIIFVYCLLGAIMAIAFTLATVYLGDPMMEILFLLLGWSQSVRPTHSAEEVVAPVTANRFTFQRVWA